MASGPASSRQASDVAVSLSAADGGDFRAYSIVRAKAENRVLLAALLLAILLHATAILSILADWSDLARPIIRPDEIPVDLIFEDPPKVEAPPKEEQRPPAPPPMLERESGDDPNLAPGRAAEVAPNPSAPEPAPAPSTEAATPAPEPLEVDKAGEFDMPLRKPTPPAPPLPPKPVETPPAPPQAAATPPAPQLQQRQPSRLAIVGQGGGDSYLNRLRDLIEKQRSYPVIGNPMRLSGTAIYELRINRAGEIVSLALWRSSGVGPLDEEGAKMVRRAAPFPPVPPDIPMAIVPLRLDLPIYP